ncbi:MAG: CaiB/BaiF CoA-transferase family protein, partial [Pseudomonadota bacterium]
ERNKPDGARGQVVDVALYEAMFNLMEGVVPEYSGAGAIREASGTTITGIVPTNTYRCGDGSYVVIGANGDSMFVRLMRAMGRDDIADDPRFAKNAGRVEEQTYLDDTISAWTGERSSQQVIETLEAVDVPVGPIYSVADMFNDPHYRSRGMFESVNTDAGPLDLPAILPRLSDTPGATEWPGGAVGSHTDEVLKVAGYTEEEVTALRKAGDI